MQTRESLVCIDASSASGERAAAALDLAVRLRKELLGAPPRKPMVNRPPLYRLADYFASRQPHRNGATGKSASFHQEKREGPRSTKSRRYIALKVDDVERLQRLAHMLATLSGELNLLLAGLQPEDAGAE